MAIIILYISLKFSRKGKAKQGRFSGMQEQTLEEILREYTNHHQDPDIIMKINIFMMKLIFTQKVEVHKESGIAFYENEAKIHHNDESSIFLCMHKKLDPAIIQVIHDSKFPGLRQKSIGFIQETFKTRCITSFQNLIIENQTFGYIWSLFSSVLKIINAYIDLFKDTFLACNLLVAVGPASVFGYPTQFTSAIVIISWASIIWPLIASTLHLVLYNPFLLFNLEVSRSVMVVLCVMCWVINPILLLNCYETVREKTTAVVKNTAQSFKTPRMLKAQKEIKTHLVQFHKIELGRYMNYLFCTNL